MLLPNFLLFKLSSLNIDTVMIGKLFGLVISFNSLLTNSWLNNSNSEFLRILAVFCCAIIENKLLFFVIFDQKFNHTI